MGERLSARDLIVNPGKAETICVCGHPAGAHKMTGMTLGDCSFCRCPVFFSEEVKEKTKVEEDDTCMTCGHSKSLHRDLGVCMEKRCTCIAFQKDTWGDLSVAEKLTKKIFGEEQLRDQCFDNIFEAQWNVFMTSYKKDEDFVFRFGLHDMKQLCRAWFDSGKTATEVGVGQHLLASHPVTMP